MANPQVENGFLRLANELVEAMMRTNLSAYQSRILWAIWRRTYGFNRKEDWISNSQLVEMTGIRKQHISRTIKELFDRNLVTKSGYKFAFNKDYTQWRELPKQVTVTNSGYKVTNSGNIVTSTGEHKRRQYYKDNNIPQKESPKKKPKSNGKNPDTRIRNLIDFFSSTVLERKGFKPVIDSADASVVEKALKIMTEDEVQAAISFYLGTPKAKDQGITLSIALSKHSLNLFQESTAKSQTKSRSMNTLEKIKQAQSEIEAHG